MSEAKVKKPNKVVKFCKDLISETKKVTWPGKKQVLNNTGVVLVVCILSGIGLFLVDAIFGALVGLIG